ncbi:MAG: DUF805 domain-containing protein [Prevotella sp.]|nr:DUF805 domain-containing protein [Prevotella sp.]
MENVVATPMMSFMDAVKKCFANYANFNGRARRSEFWWFYLLVAAVNGILGWILQIFAAKKAAVVSEAISVMFSDPDKLAALEAQEASYANINLIIMIVMAVWALGTLLPMLAAGARRLHDVGKSGHLQWLWLVCGIGGLIPLIMCIPDGSPAPNQYGESPKYVPQTV